MTERLRIVTRIAELPAADWRELAQEHPALRLEVLQAITESATRPLPLQIFLLEDAAGIAAAALCQPVSAADAHCSLDTLLYGRAARLARRLGATTRPVLQVSAPVGTGASVLLRRADPAEQGRLLDQLLSGIERHASEQDCGIAFIDLSADRQLLISAIAERGYVATEIHPTARMEVEWSNFDGYVKHLRKRSKKAAATVRHERNRNRSAGVHIRQIPSDAAAAQDLDRLARGHFFHRNRREPLFGPQFLPQLQRTLGEDLLLFEAVRDGKRFAMLGVVRSGSVGSVSWFGIELENRANDFTYANLAYYHLADCAAALGLKSLLYGNAVLQAKRQRGCRVSASLLLYRPRRRLLRLAARPYFALHRAWYRRKLQ